MSIYQSGEFMSLCSQPRIGLALQPICLLFLSDFQRSPHKYRHYVVIADLGDLSSKNTLLTRNLANVFFREKNVELASILASLFFLLGKNETRMCLVQLENVNVTFNVLKRIIQERTF